MFRILGKTLVTEFDKLPLALPAGIGLGTYYAGSSAYYFFTQQLKD